VQRRTLALVAGSAEGCTEALLFSRAATSESLIGAEIWAKNNI